MKVLIATEKPFASAAVEGIRKEIEGAGYELALLEKYTNKQQLLDAVADVDALIIRSDKVDNAVLEAAKNLKIVVRAGAGYDNVDLAAATAHGVVVMNTPGRTPTQLPNWYSVCLYMLYVISITARPAPNLKERNLVSWPSAMLAVTWHA